MMEEENAEPFRVFRLKRNPTTMHFPSQSRASIARKSDSKCPSSAQSRNASFSSKHSDCSLNTSVYSTGSAALAARAAWRHEIHQSKERHHAALRELPENQPLVRPTIRAAAIDHLCGAGAVVGPTGKDLGAPSSSRPRRRVPRAQQQHVNLFGVTAAAEVPAEVVDTVAESIRQETATTTITTTGPSAAAESGAAATPTRARSCPPPTPAATSNQLYGSGLAWQAPALASLDGEEEATAPVAGRGRRRAKRTVPRETERRTQSASQMKRLQMLEGSGSFW